MKLDLCEGGTFIFGIALGAFFASIIVSLIFINTRATHYVVIESQKIIEGKK